MKRHRKGHSLDDSNFGPTDPHLEEMTAVAFSDLVSFRQDLGLRLHQTLDDVRKHAKLSKEEFRFLIDAVKDAERRFAACLNALAWSKPLPCEVSEAHSLTTTKKAKKADPDVPSPERLEPFADGTLRALERYRRDLGLRQFQALEDAQCPAGMTLTELKHLKQMLRAYQMFYAIRIADLVTHHHTHHQMPRVRRRRRIKGHTTS